MDEFSLINCLKQPASVRDDVILGIGDDAACLEIPAGFQLLVSTDTLVAGVHFIDDLAPSDIAYRAVMTNVSDIAAMGGVPSWITLALTLPESNNAWVTCFSEGLHQALKLFNIALVGGDTTRGPLAITITIHGLIPKNTAVKRKGALPGDEIWVSGYVGTAAAALACLQVKTLPALPAIFREKLWRPFPRIDLAELLRTHASSAIDISDGLTADLQHICDASQVGACLNLTAIPLHPLVLSYFPDKALEFALQGGDDYELCFTAAPTAEIYFLNAKCVKIGVVEEALGLRSWDKDHGQMPLVSSGYKHF